MIPPRTLKGFRDFLPHAMIPRERLMETARRVYRSYGFCPIDTPALEYLEILTGKGSAETDRQLYRFQDHGGRDVGMRFDLTVPLARFVAQHIHQLGTPFKRYHIATVWRGENTQRGRYREFMQCDFDTIGTTSVAADIETVLVIHDLLRAVGISDFTMRVNHRKVLSGLLDKLGLVQQTTEILRALDKLPKIGRDRVTQEMCEVAGATRDQAQQVLRLTEISGRPEEILRQVAPLVAGSPDGEAGIADLDGLLRGAQAAGVPESRLQLDVSIARGLDYYTGTVIETFLNDLPEIGSVCSGGRYDNLAELYSNQQLPGIGASLGLDRLLAAMEELNLVESVSTTATVLVAYFDRERLHDYLRLAAQVRENGFGVELYPEPKKLGQQLKYAAQRGFRVALIAGESELAAGSCQIKDLNTRSSVEVSTADGAREVTEAIRRILAAEPPA